MKQLVISTIAFMIAAATTQAFADGFVCKTADDVAITAFNNSKTPVAQQATDLVFTTSKKGFGWRTLARFTSEAGTLSNSGTDYRAIVDGSVKESSRPGETIAGVKLEDISEMRLSVGSDNSADLVLNRINGQPVELDLSCMRFAKND